MMHMLSRCARIAVTLLLPFLAFGCLKDSKQKILGKWQETGEHNGVVEFFQDGTYRIRPRANSDSTLEGKWTIKKTRLKIEHSKNGTTETNEVDLKFEGDEMVLTDDDGREARYKRYKP